MNSSAAASLTRLASTPYEKVWGSPRTEPWYHNPNQLKIGEVWFTASEALPLLIKFLFTSERLSVQVHPNDRYARQHERSRGKTEMWHILRADPGAEIGIGLREAITPGRLREASLSGEIIDLLRWVPVQKGETFFLPAGTIHAIGAGVAVCEVQELSDVTYRLYDYGRGRELHLDRGLEVSRLEPADVRAHPISLGNGHESLVDCTHFHTERILVRDSHLLRPRPRNTACIALEGEGTIAGLPFAAGDGFEAAAGMECFEIQSSNAVFLITSEP